MSETNETPTDQEDTTIQPESEVSKELSYVSGELEILGIYSPLRTEVDTKSDKVEAIVNDDNEKRDDVVKKNRIYGFMDIEEMDALLHFFSERDIYFDGHPWENIDGEDFPGHYEISCFGLNQAIDKGKIIMIRDENTEDPNTSKNVFRIKGLDEYVSDFKAKTPPGYYDEYYDGEVSAQEFLNRML